MSIKYVGKLVRQCDMCGKYGNHMYLDGKEMAKGLFPEVDWKDLYICEKCAKREAGNKLWKKLKRRT